MNFRKFAMYQPCQVRLLCCNNDPATTVLAHLRLIGISGLGLKCPDLLGAWACSTCHNYADTHHDDETTLAFYRGIFRTQNELIKQGKVKC